MPKVRELAVLAEKWQRKASAASTDYETGVKNPLNSWQAGAIAAEGAWEQGIQQAVARKAFGAGVRAAGDAKWQKGAIEKGARRYSEGVGLAKDAWATGWEPYRATIEGITLPPKGPRGDPKNYERMRVIADALHQTRLRRTGVRRG